MARDVSPLRPARPRVRLQDLDRPALIRLIEVLHAIVVAVEWRGEGGYWEESACPYPTCSASPHEGTKDHEPDCPIGAITHTMGR